VPQKTSPLLDSGLSKKGERRASPNVDGNDKATFWPREIRELSNLKQKDPRGKGRYLSR